MLKDVQTLADFYGMICNQCCRKFTKFWLDWKKRVENLSNVSQSYQHNKCWKKVGKF